MYDARKLVAFMRENFAILDVTDEDFKKPTAEKFLQIYHTLLQSIMNIPDANLETLPFSAYPTNCDPDLFREITPKLILAKSIRVILSEIEEVENEFEFELADLTNPQPKSSICFISSLIDFYKFTVERSKKTNEIFRKYYNRAELKLEMQMKLDELKSKTDKKQKENKSAELRMTKKRETMQRLREKLAHSKADADKQGQINDQHENHVKSEEAAITELEQSGDVLCKELQELSRNVVSSPDRFQLEIKELRVQSEDTADQLAQSKEHVRQTQERIVNLESNFGLIERQMDDLKELQIVKTAIENRKKRAIELETLLSEQAGHMKSIKMEIAETEQKMVQLKGKRDKGQRRLGQALEDLAKRKKAYEKKMSRDREKADQRDLVAVDLEKRLKEETDAINQQERKFNAEAQQLDSACRLMETKYKQMQTELEIYLKNSAETFAEIEKVLNHDYEADL